MARLQRWRRSIGPPHLGGLWKRGLKCKKNSPLYISGAPCKVLFVDAERCTPRENNGQSTGADRNNTYCCSNKGVAQKTKAVTAVSRMYYSSRPVIPKYPLPNNRDGVAATLSSMALNSLSTQKKQGTLWKTARTRTQTVADIQNSVLPGGTPRERFSETKIRPKSKYGDPDCHKNVTVQLLQLPAHH